LLQRVVRLSAFLILLLIATLLMLQIGATTSEVHVSNVWFYSGLAMLLFSMFYIEPYYTAPRNVLAHSITVILVLLSVAETAWGDSGFSHYWLALVSYSGLMAAIAWVSMILTQPDRDQSSLTNRIAAGMKDAAVALGDGRVLYSGVFLLFLPILR